MALGEFVLRRWRQKEKPMTVTDLVAVYAAIVATGALLLEVRRWVESGPRLYVTMMVDPLIITPGVGVDERLALSVSVDNRGTASTTITNLCLLHYPTVFHRILNRTDHLASATARSQHPCQR